MRHQPFGYALAMLAGMSWAFATPGIKYTLDTYQVPPLVLAFWRDAFAAGTLLVLLLVFRPKLLRVGWRDLGMLALVGAICIGFYHALWVYSIELNGAAVAIVLIYTFPVWVTLGGWMLFGERPDSAQFAALGLSLLGCALLVRIYDAELLRLSWVGAAIGLLSAMVQAIYVLYSQRAATRYSSWTALVYLLLFGGLALLTTQSPAQLLRLGPDPAPWIALALLGMGPTLVGYALFSFSLRYIPGRVSSLLATVEVPASVLIAVLWLGERLEWPQLGGMACILLAVLLPNVAPGRSARELPREAAPTEPHTTAEA
jgi:drug/metabolite transporter, DME family